ncbi:MAG: glutathione S- transferase, nitrogen catabolite repression regulator [Piccolia ochrophora]|nr:MAG: glutathione S- transferase, nitrogen catabolite repression regulator [Piccolia ochrophora]
MAIKPIILYTHASGPNPWKVTVVLEELALPYENRWVDFADIKKPAYEKININGRVPAIEDPNTGITLWESAAILEYLVDQYDTEGKLTYKTGNEKYLVSQWLYFQMSGQGPYVGQFAWFVNYHPEKIESAVTRYKDQTLRVLSVLDRALQGKEYLVGDKATIADLAFVPWDALILSGFLPLGVDVAKEYPTFLAWHERIVARPAVKRTIEAKQKASAGSH